MAMKIGYTSDGDLSVSRVQSLAIKIWYSSDGDEDRVQF